MKTFAALLLGIAVLYLSGCALPNAKLVSAEDITETTTRFYPERTADDVREAVREMFYLMDGDQVKVQENESVILGDRRVFIYAVLAITDMTWRYEVYTSEIPSGTAVRVNVSLARNGSVAGGIAPVGVVGGMPMAATASLAGPPGTMYALNEVAHTALLDRLDYLLGRSNSWPTCSIIKGQAATLNRELKQEGYMMTNSDEPLCLMAKDRTPDHAKLAETRDDIKEAEERCLRRYGSSNRMYNQCIGEAWYQHQGKTSP